MSWLLPAALTIAGIAATAAVALHFIARSRPLAEPLPTARFIPQRPVQARTRSVALSDLLLLLLRIAAIATIGAAVAGPVFAAARGRVARVIAVDRSRSVASIAEARDSVRALLRSGDVLVAFDSAAAVAPSDSVLPSDARGSLSVALAAATRAAVGLAARTDSVELIVVSPFSAEEVDEATSRIRGSWPGRVRAVRTRAAVVDATVPRVQSAAGANDAVVAGLSLMGLMSSTGNVRLERGRVSTIDSAWAREAGHVLAHWPASDSAAGWRARAHIDAIGGVASSSGTLIARFPRLWVLTGAPVARWADGEVAAVEHATGAGCIRDVGVLLDVSSDITLRAPFRQFAAALVEPCGGSRVSAPIDSSALAAFTGGGPLAIAASFRDDRNAESSRWTPWLLVLGAALLLLELAARRPERRLA